MVSEIQKIPGGTVYHSLSAVDPAGTFFVRCNRHEDYVVRVDHNYFSISGISGRATRDFILDQALDLLAKCPECVKESIVVVSPSCPQEEHDACGCAK